VVVIVGGVAAWYVTRPPPPKPTPAPTPTPTHAIVGQVTIAMTQDLTGSDAASGEQVLWGAQLATSQINSQGGIYLANGPNGPGNYTINLVWLDDQSSPSVLPTVTAQAITTYHPPVLISAICPCAEATMMPIIEQYNQPTIMDELMVQYLTLTANYTPNLQAPMLFNDEPAAPIQDASEVEFLHYAWFDLEHNTAPLRIVLVATSGTWGNTEAYAINQTIYANGWQNQVKLVDTIFVTEGTSEYGPTLARVVSDNPGAIITALVPPDRANFVEQAATFPQLKGILTINDAISDDPSYYSSAGRFAAGTFVGGTAYSLMSNPNNATIAAKWNTFREEYHALSGQMPGALAASGYDHMWIIAYALKDAGSTNTTAVLNALDNLPLSPGLESHLVRIYAPTPQGTVFFTNPDSGMYWHSANFQPIIVEAFWNSTSNSVYTQVVWPPQLATTSPVLGLFP